MKDWVFIAFVLVIMAIFILWPSCDGDEEEGMPIEPIPGEMDYDS